MSKEKNHSNIEIDVTLSLMSARPAIHTCIKAGITPFLWSSPGCGKTASVLDLTHVFPDDIHNVIVLDAAMLADGTVQGGVPVADRERGVTRWLPPDYFVNQLTDKTLIFLDDVSTLPMSSFAPLLRMVQMGQIGSFEMPKGVRFICAGNRETEGAGAQKLSTAFNNRVTHISIIPDAEEVVRHALSANWSIEVPMFLRLTKDALSEFDKNEKAFPSPRAWEKVSTITKHLKGVPEDVAMALICGTVGKNRGVEYNEFRKVFAELPDVTSIFMSPTAAPVPSKPDAQYAVCGMIAKAVTPDSMAAMIAYLDRMPQAMMVSCVSDAMYLKKELKVTKPFVEWCSSRPGLGDLLF